jgi:hypothetical protein
VGAGFAPTGGVDLTASRIFDFCKAHWTDIGVVAVCALATLLLGACAVAFGKREAGEKRSPRLDETGGLSEEMVLVFPFFLIFLSITVQLILMLNARLMVNYAAFVAGRSASVWIPATTSTERSNSIQIQPPSSTQPPSDASAASDASGLTQSPEGDPTEKYERVQNAAALACAPISPNYFALMSELAPPLAPAFNAAAGVMSSVLSGVPGTAQTLISLAPRWKYASWRTTVYFKDDPKGPLYTFGPNDDIKVTVEHDFYLAVPWAARLLSTGTMNVAPYIPIPAFLSGLTSSLVNSHVYYIPITESYVFHNEGEPLAPGY